MRVVVNPVNGDRYDVDSLIGRCLATKNMRPIGITKLNVYLVLDNALIESTYFLDLRDSRVYQRRRFVMDFDGTRYDLSIVDPVHLRYVKTLLALQGVTKALIIEQDDDITSSIRISSEVLDIEATIAELYRRGLIQ
jgi:hypothetical protein